MGRSIHKVSIVFVLLVVMIGCQIKSKSDIEMAYDVLSVSYLTYDTSFTVLGPLADIGVLSEADWDNAARIGKEYKKYHNLAVSAFSSWHKSGASQDRDSFFKYYNLAMDFMRELQIVTSEAKTKSINRGR